MKKMILLMVLLLSGSVFAFKASSISNNIEQAVLVSTEPTSSVQNVAQKPVQSTWMNLWLMHYKWDVVEHHWVKRPPFIPSTPRGNYDFGTKTWGK